MKVRDSKRQKRLAKKNTRKLKRALKMSDKQLLDSAFRAVRWKTDKPTDLPPKPRFKSKNPTGEKCLAWISYNRGYRVRPCGKKAVIPGYCEEHQPKSKQR